MGSVKGLKPRAPDSIDRLEGIDTARATLLNCIHAKVVFVGFE